MVLIEELIHKAKLNPKRIVLPECEDRRTTLLAC